MNSLVTQRSVARQNERSTAILDQRFDAEFLKLKEQAASAMTTSTILWDTEIEYAPFYWAEDAELALLEIKAVDVSYEKLIKQLGDLSTLAKLDEIKAQVVFMLASIPKNNSTDPAVHLKAMVVDVASVHPTRIALHDACYTLRRTKEWAPAICEMLAALDAAEKFWSVRREVVSDLAAQRQDAIDRVARVHAVLHSYAAGKITEHEYVDQRRELAVKPEKPRAVWMRRSEACQKAIEAGDVDACGAAQISFEERADYPSWSINDEKSRRERRAKDENEIPFWDEEVLNGDADETRAGHSRGSDARAAR
jgi:hypothetical protein